MSKGTRLFTNLKDAPAHVPRALLTHTWLGQRALGSESHIRPPLGLLWSYLRPQPAPSGGSLHARPLWARPHARPARTSARSGHPRTRGKGLARRHASQHALLAYFLHM